LGLKAEQPVGEISNFDENMLLKTANDATMIYLKVIIKKCFKFRQLKKI